MPSNEPINQSEYQYDFFIDQWVLIEPVDKEDDEIDSKLNLE